MKKIMVIGCCGSGKSTFSKRLQEKTKLPVVHLDQLYWLPNWTESEVGDWEKKVTTAANQPSWIIDGNYGGTMDIRLEKADTIIYLDRSRWLCTWRILKRTIQSYGKTRADMAEGCAERFDLEFIHYTFIFNTIKRPKLLKKLNSISDTKKVIILKSEQGIEDYLLSI